MMNSKTLDSSQKASSASRCQETLGEVRDQLRLFVSTLTVKVLTKCGVIQNCTSQQWSNHATRLINQTMEGLGACKNIFPDKKSIRNTCNGVMIDLKKAFSGKRLESVIGSQDPNVDTVIVQLMQTRVKDLYDLLKYEEHGWMSKVVLRIIMVIVGVLFCWIIISVLMV